MLHSLIGIFRSWVFIYCQRKIKCKEIKIISARCVPIFGHKQAGFKQFLLATFCVPSFKGLLHLNLWDLDTWPHITICSYIPHILNNPTSQVDSMCSFFYGDPELSPVGTSILMHNPILNVDKPIWIWACFIYISWLTHSHSDVISLTLFAD